MDRKQIGAWALYDFANSIYPAVMLTAVFPLFYAGVVVGGETGRGDAWWGAALSVSALIVALSAPLLGAIADRGGARKRFMAAYVAACLVALMFMVTLRAGMPVWGFVLFVVATVGFEGSLVFYNAYLPDIAPPDRQGRVSGLGFGLGYLGSAVGLALALAFALNDRVTAVWPVVAVFYLVFSIPAFLYLPADRGSDMSIRAAAVWGVSHFRTIVGEVLEHRDLRRFLLAYFFFIDGVLTIIGMAGRVAEQTFGFSQTSVIVLFMIVQISALIGAFALAKPTDVWGPKRVLDVVLVAWIATGITAYFLQDPALFYVMAVVAGLGLGSLQSASRSFMSLLIPEGKEAEMFGFYALCGKSSSVIGPMLFGWASLRFGSQRPGFLILTGMFLIGLLLLQRVTPPRVRVT